jgi:hypothetical protein
MKKSAASSSTPNPVHNLCVSPSVRLTLRSLFPAMKVLRLIPLLLIALFVAGCAALTKQDQAVLASHNVPPDVYQKMLYGDPLSIADVITLSRRAVPAGLIVKYMDDVNTIYVLRKQDVAKLRSGGVSETVIGYMLSTTPPYMSRGAGPYVAYPYGAPPGYPWGPYPYGYPSDYYDAYYPGPVVFVGNYGGWWHGGWGRGGWGGRGGGWGRHH